MHQLVRKLAPATAAALAVSGIGIATATTASANTSYTCTATTHNGNATYRRLHATAVLINYGSARGTAVSVSATSAYTQVIDMNEDLHYKFHRVWIENGYGIKYTNPAQWGSYSRPLNFSTKIVDVEWKAQTGDVVRCRFRAGV